MLIKSIHAHYRFGDHAQLKYSNNVKESCSAHL